jgi:hypothetical protein
MAVIEIIINDAHVAEMIEVFGEKYQAQVPGPDGNLVPNPLTKGQWAYREVVRQIRDNYIRRKVLNYRERTAVIDQTDITIDPIGKLEGVINAGATTSGTL